MSSVVIQIGQCGNQIGSHFWKLVGSKEDCRNGGIFLHPGREQYMYRSINIDSEPKVVKSLVSESQYRDVGFRPSNVILGKRGRGSNWAMGYSGVLEENLLERGLEATRKEIERCDCYSGSIMIHSLCGGTGSGLGSRMSEVMREEMPIHHLLNCVVAPYSSGESPLQHYNALLSLGSLLQNSDSIILFNNDEILQRLQKQKQMAEVAEGSSSRHTPSVTFSEINQHISYCLGGVFLPCKSITPRSGVSIGSEPWEMVRSVCPMPTNKFVHFNHLARSKLSWLNLTDRLLQTVPTRDSDGTIHPSISALVVARGDISTSPGPDRAKIEQRVKKACRTVTWNPFPVDFWADPLSLSSQRPSASLTVATNSSHVVRYLQHTAEKAWQKFHAKAYLHWYQAHGCSEDMFEEAFNTVLSAVENYKSAVA